MSKRILEPDDYRVLTAAQTTNFDALWSTEDTFIREDAVVFKDGISLRGVDGRLARMLTLSDMIDLLEATKVKWSLTQADDAHAVLWELVKTELAKPDFGNV